MSWNKNTSVTTKHNHPVCFGKREAGCPRCAELNAGAVPRRGWGHAKKQAEAAQCAAIKAWFSSAECAAQTARGVVCTKFEW